MTVGLAAFTVALRRRAGDWRIAAWTCTKGTVQQ